MSIPVYTDGRYKRFEESQIDYKVGGYARVKEGDRLNHGRYELVKKLGIGHFGVVWLAWDREDAFYVAIKLIRSAKRYSRAAMNEDKLLTVLQGPKDERKRYIVSFLNSFEEPAWEGNESHVCLVFEVMGMSLTDVLRKNEFHGLPIKTAKLVTKQILTSLSYLHSLSVAHTDIKPDNILLYHSPRKLDKLLYAQLERESQERERLEKEAALNPPPEPINWMEYKPRIPGLSPAQIRDIQMARVRSEARKWVITPSGPIDSPIPFVQGRRIHKEYVQGNRHLYKKPKKPVEIGERNSVSHPDTDTLVDANDDTTTSSAAAATHSFGEGLKPNETPSTQTTPTKDGQRQDQSLKSASTPIDCNSEAEDESLSSPDIPSKNAAPSASATNATLPVQSDKVDTSMYPILSKIQTDPQALDPPPPTTSIRATFQEMSLGMMFFQRESEVSDPEEDTLAHKAESELYALKYRSKGASSTGKSFTGGGHREHLVKQRPLEHVPLASDTGLVGLGVATLPGGDNSLPLPEFPSASLLQERHNITHSDPVINEMYAASGSISVRRQASSNGGAFTASPASATSTAIFSSPEITMTDRISSPGSSDNNGTIVNSYYATEGRIPRSRALARSGSGASALTSPGSGITSFSPNETGSTCIEDTGVFSLNDRVRQASGSGTFGSIPSTSHYVGGLPLARSGSGLSLDESMTMQSLPASPPSHPTSYISLSTSISPEATLNPNRGGYAHAEFKKRQDALIREDSYESLDMLPPSMESISQEQPVQLQSAADTNDFGTVPRGELEDATVKTSMRQGSGLANTSEHHLGIPPFKSGISLSRDSTDGVGSGPTNSQSLSSSPPVSMLSSMLSAGSDNSSQSPPVSVLPTGVPSSVPKIEKLDSPKPIKSDPLLNVHVKLADLGNAIFYHELKSRKALPENVCTRQYRPPENIIQAEYDLGIDIWAVGCVVYEMITGDMLFNPTSLRHRFTKEDDLLGQQMEILGEFDPEFALSGKRSLSYFNLEGRLFRLPLKPWLLLDVLIFKYYMPREKAVRFSKFLLRMLEPNPAKRAKVDELLQDPWLSEIEEDDDLVLWREKRKPSVAPTEDNA